MVFICLLFGRMIHSHDLYGMLMEKCEIESLTDRRDAMSPQVLTKQCEIVSLAERCDLVIHQVVCIVCLM